MAKRSAFTLIELLVVIAIIGLLMAMLMPAMARVREQAKSVTCRSTLVQWGKVFVMYTMDNDGYFASGSSGQMWTTFLQPYYVEPDLRLCPMAIKPSSETGSATPYGGKFMAWGVFDETYAQLGLEGVSGSYGMNGHVSNPPAGVTTDQWGRDLTKTWRSTHVRQTNTIPLFLDCVWLGGAPEQSDAPPQFDGYYEPTALGVNMQGFCIDRHNGKVNALFVDFSVQPVGLKQLWKLKWHQKFDIHAHPPIWPEWMENFKDYD
jgi:prepilin-type N-terminal cleavage/methylation domain-containing protein/prepilin-type processing-associated H-X9-DG protein